MNYLPGKLSFPSVNHEDTFLTFRVSTVKIDGAVPTSALALVEIDFRTSPDATGAASLALSSATGDGITINDAAAWDFQIDEHEVTLAPGTYCQAIRLTDAAGVVRTYTAGIFTVGQNITKT